MKNITLLVCISLFINGVATDKMESVSVMEGDTVTLRTDLTELQRQDLIEWRTGVKQELVAKINREANTSKIDDERFRGRLKLNNQNGDLTITNITTQLTGLYHLEITRQKPITKTFNVSGVFGVTDEMKSVSVKEGDFLTLHIDLSDRQKYDVIVWRFQLGNSPLAELNRKTPIFRTYDNVHDGIFRDKLKLDFQTGSFTITNIRTNHAGLYEVDFSSGTHTIHQSITVTVNAQGLSSGAVAGICVLVVLLLIAVAGVLFCIYSRISEANEPEVMEGDHVILHTDLTRLKRHQVIKWWFGDQNILIAEMKRSQETINDDVLNGIFRGRLALRESGSLIINDARTTDAGLYQLKITGSRKLLPKKFELTVKGTHKQDQVIEGNSYTLKTDIADIQRDDVIEWRFGETLIAEITPANNIFSTYDGDDNIFRDKLKLNHQTLELTINDIRHEHAGDYTLKIVRGGETSYRRFTLSLLEPGINQPLLNEDGVSGTRESSV